MGKEEPQRPRSWKETSASCKGQLFRCLLAFEWVCRWVVYGLSKVTLLKVLEYFGKLTLLTSLILWIYPGFPQRKQASDDSKKSRHYVAWQTINSAIGKPGNAGRSDALQDLNCDGVPLNGISLTGGVVLIGPLNLSNARMESADFSGGRYNRVDFSRAELMMSKWENTFCESCDFRGASFWAVTFRNSKFLWCDFSVAGDGKNQAQSVLLPYFGDSPTSFTICNFVGTALPIGELKNVDFAHCNFADAELWQPFIGTNAAFEFCNLYNAKTSSPEFIKWAYGQRLVFTNITSLDRWRYCVTNGLTYQQGGPEFMEWASNQFTTYIKTNDVKAWLDWSRQNLPTKPKDA